MICARTRCFWLTVKPAISHLSALLDGTLDVETLATSAELLEDAKFYHCLDTAEESGLSLLLSTEGGFILLFIIFIIYNTKRNK